VNVDERRAEPPRRAQLGRQHGHRSFVIRGVAAGEIDQVGRVDHQWLDPGRIEPGAEGRDLGRWRGPSPPFRRVVAEDLESGRADLGGPLGGFDHASAEGEVGSEASSVGQHPRHRSGRHSATVGRWRTVPGCGN
jgi:hypothetical protein